MQKPDPDFVAFIGIDWADKRHDVRLAVSATADPFRTSLSSKLFQAQGLLSHRVSWLLSASVDERFPTAAAFQKYVGVAPVTERSGNQSSVHWRFSCSTFIRQTLVEWTEQTIPQSFWAKAFYERHRAKGASHNATIGALVFKWIRVLWRCWVDRVPYDESRYRSALRRRGSALISFAAQNSS